MRTKKQKVLIVKVGYSETLDPEISNVTSYGDVLRTTVLLNLYKNDHVTWLVDEKAYPILKNNPYIDRILIYDLTSVLQLQSEHFDTVINLEKVPGLCALADQVTAWRRYGFRFDVKKGEAEAYEGTQNALSMCYNEEKKKKGKRYWQEHLFEMVGATWHNQEYVLGYQPKTTETYDVGFNYQVGNKWPSKVWSMNNWEKLQGLLSKNYSVSWQQGLDNMEQYFEWINSCRVIVTNDSFGLHLAIALKKKVVAIYGSTSANEIYLYELGSILVPKDDVCPDVPCYLPKCRHDRKLCDVPCQDVYTEVCRLLDKELNAAAAEPTADMSELRQRVTRQRTKRIADQFVDDGPTSKDEKDSVRASQTIHLNK
ncbi:MAG: glycosyltransferase family 9 protein [Planctomycetota bacterium]